MLLSTSDPIVVVVVDDDDDHVHQQLNGTIFNGPLSCDRANFDTQV